ncbi:methyltransferase domain-containing protein [Geomonas nitrogeniifigens]|uniref:Methyltransferase domain-containing protein n=1 Tax=Geomonas diazotrophica TaxID=2843197 RepID=A0ABX8JIC7_9BACT|nr:methyltransferase domain-containing protein [Geomonas nitrogeniifigens]QWV96384.1 methyltransferase domain-containing protein [Geomonas nitrogeniifigens]QXE85451.1 methyltransferase domain-containing protein [Geomonas nitrogeniifigens]
MTNDKEQAHREKIIEQFSQQAVPFTQVPGHHDALQALVELSGVGERDEVLDVACGPGMVACAFARRARQVTGVDITPAMIEQARQRQAEQQLANLTWDIGTAVPLPYPDDSFSLVLTRYSFHHLLDPQGALAEMIRVCRPGGAVMVADVAVPSAKSAAYDRLELIRDPSHTHALTEEEFSTLFQRSGLVDCRRSTYGVDIELETQIRASSPKPGDDQVIREMVTADVGVDSLGINARREDGKIVYTVPIAVYVGRKR